MILGRQAKCQQCKNTVPIEYIVLLNSPTREDKWVICLECMTHDLKAFAATIKLGKGK